MVSVRIIWFIATTVEFLFHFPPTNQAEQFRILSADASLTSKTTNEYIDDKNYCTENGGVCVEEAKCENVLFYAVVGKDTAELLVGCPMGTSCCNVATTRRIVLPDSGDRKSLDGPVSADFAALAGPISQNKHFSQEIPAAISQSTEGFPLPQSSPLSPSIDILSPLTQQSPRHSIRKRQAVSALAVWNQCLLMERAVQRVCNCYERYGNWCGRQGSGGCADSIDDCCFTRNRCIDRYLAQGCNVNQIETQTKYRVTAAPGGQLLTCVGAGNNHCEERVCECDMRFALCIARNNGVFNQAMIGRAPQLTDRACVPQFDMPPP